jgi:flagellin
MNGITLFSGTLLSISSSKESGDAIEITATALADFSDTAAGKALEDVDTAITALADGDAGVTAQALIDAAEAYITAIGTQRAELGAIQNQMDYAISNVTQLSADLTAARSRVIDTDYATETASLTKGQILQQAATAMLAQANQMPNVILSLLK